VLVPFVAQAQSDTGGITVSVVDAASNSPISNARVFLSGVVMASALTTRGGVVRYTDVPTGIYHVRVARAGYDVISSNEFDVLGGKAVTLRFSLLPATANGKLRVIGAVTVRSTVQVSTHAITADSPARRISGSLLDALDTLGGVSVNQSSNDPDSVVTISLNGHDESQTAVTVDGIPLSAPGVAANLRGIATDLFTSAGTSFSPTASGLGGSVNFRTLEPTQSWNERVSASDGTYDHWNYQISTTGSDGRLGIAVMHTSRGANNPLSFESFEDESGLTYSHGGFSTLDGDLVKMRYRLGDNTSLTGAFLTSNSAVSLLCTQDTTLLPCGFGPGSNLYNRFALGYGTFASLIGNVGVTATAYSATSEEDLNEQNRVLGGTLDPFDSLTQRRTNGYSFTASLPTGRHTLSLSGNTFASSSVFNPVVTQTLFIVPSFSAINAHQLQLADVIKSSDKLALNANITSANTSGIGSSLLGGGGATWTPTTNDSVQFAASYGSAQPGSIAPRTLSDPDAARFVCASGTTVVYGPPDPPQKQFSASYNADWTHSWSNGQLTVDAYRQSQLGQTISGLISAAGEPPGFLPGGYIDRLEQAWALPTVCGNATFSPLGIYVIQPISGTARLYQGIDASARVQLGRYVMLLPTYALNIAMLVAGDPRLNVPQSPMIVGAQLPARPIHRAGLTVDGLIPRTGLELLASAQYTGANNARYLTPYTTVAAGVSRALGPGRITVFGTNLFNTSAGKFSTLQFAQPLPLQGGGSALFAGLSLTPRTWNVNYTLAVGKNAENASPLEQQAEAAARAAGSAGTEQSNGGPGGPGSGTGLGGPGGPGSGTGGGRLRNVLPAGGDPFGLASNQYCDAHAQDVARPVLQMLRGYVGAYEAHKTLPATTGFTITTHTISGQNKPAYWLDLEPENLQSSILSGRVRSLFACSYITTLGADQAQARGIETTSRVFLGYAPGIGIFSVVPRQLPPGGGNAR